MPLEITEELIARQPPESQFVLRALLAEIAALRAELDELRRQVKGKTPQNSSLSPKAHVTEYQRHRLVCPARGETTCAKPPRGVPVGQTGPRLMAFTALLMAYYRHRPIRLLVRSDQCNGLQIRADRRGDLAFRGVTSDSEHSRVIPLATHFAGLPR